MGVVTTLRLPRTQNSTRAAMPSDGPQEQASMPTECPTCSRLPESCGPRMLVALPAGVPFLSTATSTVRIQYWYLRCWGYNTVKYKSQYCDLGKMLILETNRKS